MALLVLVLVLVLVRMTVLPLQRVHLGRPWRVFGERILRQLLLLLQRETHRILPVLTQSHRSRHQAAVATETKARGLLLLVVRLVLAAWA